MRAVDSRAQNVPSWGMPKPRDKRGYDRRGMAHLQPCGKGDPFAHTRLCARIVRDFNITITSFNVTTTT